MKASVLIWGIVSLLPQSHLTEDETESLAEISTGHLVQELNNVMFCELLFVVLQQLVLLHLFDWLSGVPSMFAKDISLYHSILRCSPCKILLSSVSGHNKLHLFLGIYLFCLKIWKFFRWRWKERRDMNFTRSTFNGNVLINKAS